VLFRSNITLRGDRKSESKISVSNTDSVDKSKVNSHFEPAASQQVFQKAASATFEKKPCKFCSSTSHSMLNCLKYPTHDSRIDRCKELKLCIKCTSSKHISRDCKIRLDFKCKFCQKADHISAMC